jgi:hypothetical protein
VSSVRSLPGRGTAFGTARVIVAIEFTSLSFALIWLIDIGAVD